MRRFALITGGEDGNGSIVAEGVEFENEVHLKWVSKNLDGYDSSSLFRLVIFDHDDLIEPRALSVVSDKEEK